ncbi:hypothetical protein SSX86_013597 [Deinandra increscens subsp. villosa]|uniref:Uncharacterized protein n=1 Tax=Deinandra increscens subsp. villosa TaxID=3103831 RepID=A0AAP0D1W8_9ASTR
MATLFQPITIVSTSSSNNHRFSSRKKPLAASSSASAKWWTPLFALSSDPDYILNPATGASDLDDKGGRSRPPFAPGCFTEEKAKQMRMKTIETANFHDLNMYHSAIASRLASDVSGRYNR